MKRTLWVAFILHLFWSCDKYDIPSCSFNDASQDLLWLKTIIDERNANPTEEMRYCYISQAKLNRKTVFIFRDCNPAIDKVEFVINCEGEPIKNKDDQNISSGDVKLKEEQIIWRPQDFACDENGSTIN